MSMIGFAVRICTWRALLGQTLAGNAIEDSPVDPVSVAVEISKPYIAIFTDLQNNKPDARSLIEGYHVQDLSLHIFLPTELKMTIGGVPYEFQGRSSGAALVLDLIFRQMQLVLMSGQSVWAILWRQFVNKIVEVDSRAYVLQTGTGTGVKVPAREIVMRCDTIYDPPIGAVPEGPWADFVAALTADPDTAELGPLLVAMITGEALPQWRQDEADLGLADGEMAGLGLGPLGGQPTDDEVELYEVSFSREVLPDAPCSPSPESNPVITVPEFYPGLPGPIIT